MTFDLIEDASPDLSAFDAVFCFTATWRSAADTKYDQKVAGDTLADFVDSGGAVANQGSPYLSYAIEDHEICMDLQTYKRSGSCLRKPLPLA